MSSEAARDPARAEPSGSLCGRFADEVVLVTGFPGFKARALVELLLEREPGCSLWLVVPPAELEEAARALSARELGPERLRLIPGEPCAIDLGLSRQTYAELCRHVDRWFSFYQTTDSQAARELCFRVNLGAAREIAELSKVAQNLAHVTFLSNVVVFGDHDGDAAEPALSVGQGFPHPAGESLALAESLLRRRLDDVPLSVVRTPQIVGARAGTGVARPVGLHRLLAQVAAAPADIALPLPLGAQRLIQALPADFVAEACYVVSVLGTRGHTYHFADPEPPTQAEVLEQAAAHFGRRIEVAPSARTLGRALLKSPGFWWSQAALDGSTGAVLSTRAGDRLLDRAGLCPPSLLSYLDSVLRETEALQQASAFSERVQAQPFEVVA